MKAVIQEKYGSPEDLVLREVDVPAVGENEVLVRVRASSVHPDVWHVVSGRPYVLRLAAGLSRPRLRIPGTDVAGIVQSVGSNVLQFGPGDAVFGETVAANTWTNGGAWAEYVSVPNDQLALKPDNVTFEQAASVPTSGFIALMNLREGSSLSGQRVLINGAAGGVGSIAVQLASAWGAHVTAVDTTSKLSLLRSLGADEVIDYTQDDFTRRGVRYDLIFDVPGNHPFSACRRALEPDGQYRLIGHENFGAASGRVFGIIPYFFRLMFLSRFVKQLRGPGLPLPTRHEAMKALGQFLEAGKIEPPIDSTWPLSQAGKALRHMMEDDLQGKVVLTV